MQVPAPEGAAPWLAPLTTVTLTARVERGELAALPMGELLQAVVVKVEPGAATLLVQGRELVIQPSQPMQPGTVWLLRRPSGETGQPVEHLTLTARASPPAPPGHATQMLASTHQNASPVEAPRFSGNPSPFPAALTAVVAAHSAQPQLVEVLEQISPQTYRIEWLGQILLARSEQPLQPQHQHLVQFELRPDGLWLIRPAETSQTPRLLAAALLSQLPPADLAPHLADLFQTLAERTLATPSPTVIEGAAGKLWEPTAGDTTSRLLRNVQTALESFWPSELRPLSAHQLRHLVENGGLVYEARLAAAQSSSPTPEPRPVPLGTSGDTSAVPIQTLSQEQTALRSPPILNDLKGNLLRLIQAPGGGLESAMQAVALPVLQSIISLQAANILASHQGTPYWLQIPFPDGSAWRTLYLALHPEFSLSLGDSASGDKFSYTSQRYHILIHAPLDTMGNTWIDMTLHGDRLHAVLYFEREAALQQALALQGELHQMLQDSDFIQIGVEFRSAADLPVRHRQHAEAMRQGRPPSLHLVDWEV